MGERRILVIGSQCKAVRPPLSFLPGLAQELHAVMTDAELGGCVPALSDDGLLIDPSWAQAHKAIEVAFRRASEDEATLFLAFIGHGEYVGTDFYLLPCDASIPPTSFTALHLVQLIKELHRNYSNVDGLVVLLDACHSGVGAAGAAAKWVGELGGTLRFEVLTATNERTAADGCFSRNIAAVVREGDCRGAKPNTLREGARDPARALSQSTAATTGLQRRRWALSGTERGGAA